MAGAVSPTHPVGQLRPEALELLDRFDRAWHGTAPPRLEDFLALFAATSQTTEPAAPRAFLEELVKIDLEHRWRRAPGGKPCRPGEPREGRGSIGWRPCLEDYAKHHVELTPAKLPVDLIVEEYRVRQEWGDQPAHADYLARFGPQGKLREQLAQVDAELVGERARKEAVQPGLRPAVGLTGRPGDAVQPAAPLSAEALVEVLRQCQVLPPAQLAELGPPLTARFTDARALAKELLQRGWLTPYQVNQLLQGKGAELMLGPYALLERLGEGGTGQVFKARHVKMERIVALKLIRKELLQDPEVRARFQREIQVVSQLSHPNIVHAFDAGPVGASYFLTMEYVEGTDLDKLVRRSGPLPIAQAIDYARQAALGLQHVHEKGLVHRDVKPSNLLLVGQASVVKLSDLSLARFQQVEDAEAAAALTAAVATQVVTPAGAMMMGTPDYLAPEQALDFHAADIRADIYSLGCTLFFLLAGRAPFAGGTLAQKLLRHQNATPPDVQQLRADIPTGLAKVVQKMLAKQPADRYQTPAEVAAALESAGLRSRTLPAEQTPALSGRSGRPAVLRCVATCGLVLMVILLAWALWPTSGPHQARGPEDVLKEVPGTPGGLMAVPGDARLPFTDAVFSPKGNMLALVRKDGALRLWDLADNRLRELGTHSGITAAVFAPDGRTFATAGGDTVKLWEMPGGKLRGTLPHANQSVKAVAFDPGSKILATATDFVHLWNAADGTMKDPPLRPAPGVNAWSVALATGASYLAVGYSNGTVGWWNLATGKQERTLLGLNGPVHQVAISPDNRTLVAQDQKGGLTVWDDGKVSASLSGASSLTRALDPTFRGIVTGGEDGTVRAGENMSWKAHRGSVTALAYSRDSTKLVTAGSDRQVIVWDPRGGPSLREWANLPAPARRLAFAPDGRHIATLNGDGTVYLLQMAPAPSKTAR